jgi:hypothetical protein
MLMKNIIVKMAYASKEAKIGQFEIVTYLSSYEAIMGCAIYERWSDRSRVRKKPTGTALKNLPTTFGTVTFV